MHNISKNLYKLAWYLTPIVFLAFLIWKGEFCLMYGCIGNNNVGVTYGIGAVIVYTIILKSVGKDRFVDIKGIKNGFFYLLIILIILFVYFLGKIAE